MTLRETKNAVSAHIKSDESAEIESQIAEFKRAGGKITKVKCNFEKHAKYGREYGSKKQ